MALNFVLSYVISYLIVVFLAGFLAGILRYAWDLYTKPSLILHEAKIENKKLQEIKELRDAIVKK